MDDIKQVLDKIIPRISDENFLSNKGLGNEVGIHIFCYNPKDEIIVANFIEKIKDDKSGAFRIVECDLFKIFMDICDEKRIAERIPALENQRGGSFVLEQLQRIATPEAYIAKMQYEPHEPGDVLLITGVGKVFPFIRSHNILNNLQHYFSDIPVIMFYPGTYNGQDLILFGKFLDSHYYRAFNLI